MGNERNAIRSMVFAVVALISISPLFASGGQESGASGAKGAAKPAAKPAEIRLAWWGGDNRHKATVAAAEAFMKKYPDIVVKTEYQGFEGYYDKLITQLASGTGPDLFQFIVLWFGDVQKSPELFADLKQMPGIDLSGWPQTALDYGTLNGKVIGLPLGANGRVIVYNKDLLDASGLKIDSYMSWASFVDYTQKARAKTPGAYGYSGIMDQYYYPLIAYLVQKSGKPFITKEVTFGFTEADLVEGLKLFKGCFADGTFEPLEKTVLLKTSWTDPDWLNGKVLFNETPVTQISQQLKYSFKVGFTRYPFLDGAKLSGVEVGPNMMFCVNAKTKYPDAVAKLANFLYTDPEGVKLMALERGVPTNKKGYDVLVQNDMIDDVTKQAMALIEATDTGRYTEMEFAEVHDELISAIQKVGLVTGGSSPEEAARAFMEKANRILKASK